MALINCPECGKEISDKVKACPHCGYPFNNTDNLNIKEEKRKINRKLLISIPIIILFAIILIVILVTINSPDRKFIQSLNNNDIDTAVEIYNAHLKDNSESEKNADAELLSKIDEIVNGFIDKEQDYNSTIDQLDIYKKFTSIEDELNKSISSVNELNNSRKAYEKGIEYIKEDDSQSAIAQFQKVIKSDENYSNAQTKISELSIKLAKKYASIAAENFNNKNFIDAISNIENAIELQPDNTDYQNSLDKYKEAKEKADEEAKKLYKGKIIKADSIKAEYKGYEFTTKILPTDTSGAYTYYKSDDDEIYIDFRFKITNKGKYDLDLNSIVSNFKVNYNEGYTYDNYNLFYNDGGDIESVYSWDVLEPLEPLTLHVAAVVPRDIADTKKSLTVSFSICNQDQKVQIR